MTVKEAFNKAFGPVPDGAIIRLGYSVYYEGNQIHPIYELDDARWAYFDQDKRWQRDIFIGDEIWGPDLTNRDASAFIGFFGPAYDKVVD